LNVVSDTASATVDIRVPPTMRMAEIHEQLRIMLHNYPGLSYEVKSTVAEREYDEFVETDLYKALADAIKEHGFQLENIYMEGSTDLRFYQEKGLHGFGLTPFTVAENLHGTNECVGINDLERGLQIFITFMKTFCS
jgi:acetylornithine deacetylase/succinyl-diaminopimelate desuccinylase-like protein